MMKLETLEDVKNYLVQQKIVINTAHVEITKLSGGVSSSVWKIVSNEKRWVLKQALEKLKVQTDWFSDVERIHREHEVMQALYHIMPADSIPEILYTDYTNHVFMMTCVEEPAPTWKDILMKENFDTAHATNAGNILRCIYENSNKINESNKIKFNEQKYFIQLRVEPFHKYLIQKYQALDFYIQQLIDEVTEKKICLVHGDFSPKNMLIKKNNHLVLIDFEVAHWGNPVFDVAYCLGHLMLKGWHLKKSTEAAKLIQVFLDAYKNKVENLIPHVGLMLLARMDGKSPVDYIKDENVKNNIRGIAVEWIKGDGKKTDIIELYKDSPLNPPVGDFKYTYEK